MKVAELEANPRSGTWDKFSDYSELTKARLTLLVLLTTLAGFYMGAADLEIGLLAHTLFGTALVAGGASTLNQVLERELDARMRRTRERPLPSGRLHPDEALIIGFIISVGGLTYLLFLVNLLAATLAGLTLASYVFCYTPLKRVTSLNTIVGAVPGALPPVIGWAAASSDVSSVEPWILFAILFFWQMPHFLAIAWMYRDEYREAGFIMLTNEDDAGEATSRQSLGYALSLLTISLFPSLTGMTGPLYFTAALLLGIFFTAFAIHFHKRRDRKAARKLFLASVLYLPLLLAFLSLAKQ